ncbi:MAG: hypothetical protein JW819_06585 [Candidatus Krumholzibacteriota bacterium]|nr:hypothetical protein [Candidatus Krumholzibacteriota bacterium]
MRRSTWLNLMAAAALAVMCACDSGFEGDPIANRPPETFLSSGPLANTPDTNYRVHFYWNGYDPDGRISHFQYLITNDNVTGSLLIDDQIDETLAALGYEWRNVVMHDSIFSVSADSIPEAVGTNPDEELYWYDAEDSLGRFRYRATHTFFLRSVDEKGLWDPTPVYLTFTATTIAPDVVIRHPGDVGQVGGYEELPPDIRFSWTGNDSVGDGTVIEPCSTRFTYPPLPRGYLGLDLQSSGRILNFPDSVWSPWRGWDDEDSIATGRSVWLHGLTTADQGPDAGRFLFFIQAKDEAGALTTHFQDGRNLKKLRVVSSKQPSVVVRDDILGTFRSDHDRSFNFTIAEAQPIHLSWSGSAAEYGSEVTGFRFGWDIVDLSNDDEWSTWSTTVAETNATFISGAHTFYLQCRDYSSSITMLTFHFFVVPFTMDFDLLIIDDYNNQTTEEWGWPNPPPASWVASFAHRDDEMRDWWGEILNDYSSFILARDHIKVTPVTPIPDFATVASYKRLIWEVKAAGESTTGLYRVARFVDPYITENVPFDYLSAFMNRGGQVLLCGSYPISQTLAPSNLRTPIAFLRSLGYSSGSAQESVDAVKRFLPWKQFGVDILVFPVNPIPRPFPGMAPDFKTPRTFWGMVGAHYDGGELSQFPNTTGALPDTLELRPEVYDWFEAAGPLLAETDSEGNVWDYFGLNEIEIYNWEFFARTFDQDVQIRYSQFLPLLSYLPADSTTRWGRWPTEMHPHTTTGGEPYNELRYSLPGYYRHSICLVGMYHPETPSVLLGMSPYFLKQEHAQLLMDHIFVDIFHLPH